VTAGCRAHRGQFSLVLGGNQLKLLFVFRVQSLQLGVGADLQIGQLAHRPVTLIDQHSKWQLDAIPYALFKFIVRALQSDFCVAGTR
jgi:hypothetical protein